MVLSVVGVGFHGWLVRFCGGFVGSDEGAGENDGVIRLDSSCMVVYGWWLGSRWWCMGCGGALVV